jgi:hypothetical protein
MQVTRQFRRAFARALFSTVWTYLAIASTLVTFLPLPREWRRAIPFGIAILFVVSAYRTAWLLHKQSSHEMEGLRQRIEELSRKPYDDAHRKLVEEKLQRMTPGAADLLRYILHHGRVDSLALHIAFGANPDFQSQLGTLYLEGLLSKTEEPNPGRASVKTFWQINPQFVAVLQDLLYWSPQSG